MSKPFINLYGNTIYDDKMAGKSHLNGGQFAVDTVEGIAEGGLIGTFSYILLGALANLPVAIVPAANTLDVGLAVGAIVAIIQVAKAFKDNYA